MLTAAGLAAMPLTAGNTPPVAGNAPAATAPAAANDTMSQIAEEFAPAAMLPADVDLAIALPSQSTKLMSAGLPFGSVVLGQAKGSADSYTTLRVCQLLMAHVEMVTCGANAWKEDAAESLGDIIIQAATRFGQEANNKIASTAREFTLHPIYLVASPQAGGEVILNQTLTAYTSMLLAAAQEQEGVEIVTIDGLNGLKISGAMMAEGLETENAAVKSIKEELSKRTFYLLAGMKNGNAAIVLCENPKEIKWAPAPEQSLLPTIAAESWNGGTPGEGANPWALFLTLSPQMSQALSRDGSAITVDLIKQVGDLFQAFAEKESSQAAVFRAAATGLNTLADEIFTKPTATPFTKPTTVAAWGASGHAHITLKSDALGSTYKTGKLRLESLATSPQNIFYFETPGANPVYKPDCGKLLSAAADVVKGVHASLNPEKQGELNQKVQKYADILPELNKAGQGLCTMLEGLGSSCAIVVNSAEQVTGPNSKVLQPAFSLLADVTDRAKFEQGSAAVGAAASNVLNRFKTHEGMIRQISFESKTTGSAFICNIAAPLLPPGVCPNMTLDGNHVAFGTSIELNDNVIRSATGNTDFAGCVFSFNFTELAKVVNSLTPAPCGDAADAPEEALTPPPPSAPGLAIDDDDIDDEEDICDDDDIDDGCDNCCLDTYRDNPIITIAEYVDSMKGASTIENGVNTLNIDIKLKK